MSPDGSKLLFWDHAEPQWNIWVMDADGRNQKNLTRTREGGCRFPNWSPDGKRVAFRKDGQGLYVMNADGTAQQRLSPNDSRDDMPAWSPDGRELVFADANDDNIRRIGADGQGEKLIIKRGTDPIWTPNGKQVLFIGFRRKSAYLCLADRDGNNETLLTKSSEYVYSFLLSSDGQWIAYTAKGEGEKARLCLMDLKGEKSRCLMDSVTRERREHSWSPDGKWIAFVAGVRGKEDLCVVHVQSGQVRKLSEGGACCPAWQPRR